MRVFLKGCGTLGAHVPEAGPSRTQGGSIKGPFFAVKLRQG